MNSSNDSASVGKIDKGKQDLQIRVTGEFASIEDIKQTIVQTEEGATLHMEDVAEVKDTYKDSSSLTLVNGEPSLVLSIIDRKSTRLNSSHVAISYAVFCLKKKNS